MQRTSSYVLMRRTVLVKSDKAPNFSPECKMLPINDQLTSVHHQVLWLPTAHLTVCLCLGAGRCRVGGAID